MSFHKRNEMIVDYLLLVLILSIDTLWKNVAICFADSQVGILGKIFPLHVLAISIHELSDFTGDSILK